MLLIEFLLNDHVFLQLLDPVEQLLTLVLLRKDLLGHLLNHLLELKALVQLGLHLRLLAILTLELLQQQVHVLHLALQLVHLLDLLCQVGHLRGHPVLLHLVVHGQAGDNLAQLLVLRFKLTLGQAGQSVVLIRIHLRSHLHLIQQLLFFVPQRLDLKLNDLDVGLLSLHFYTQTLNVSLLRGKVKIEGGDGRISLVLSGFESIDLGLKSLQLIILLVELGLSLGLKSKHLLIRGFGGLLLLT